MLAGGAEPFWGRYEALLLVVEVIGGRCVVGVACTIARHRSFYVQRLDDVGGPSNYLDFRFVVGHTFSPPFCRMIHYSASRSNESLRRSPLELCAPKRVHGIHTYRGRNLVVNDEST